MSRVKFDLKHLPEDPTDWDKVRSKSDREVTKAARTDPDARPLTAAQIKRLIPPPDVKALRQKLGMTQGAFSNAFKIGISTVRDWEQKRFRPEMPARVYLAVIDQSPDAVRKALQAKMSKRTSQGGRVNARTRPRPKKVSKS